MPEEKREQRLCNSINPVSEQFEMFLSKSSFISLYIFSNSPFSKNFFNANLRALEMFLTFLSEIFRFLLQQYNCDLFQPKMIIVVETLISISINLNTIPIFNFMSKN